MANFKVSFINGAKIEVLNNNSSNEYLVKFIDNQTQHLHYETVLKDGYWPLQQLNIL